jgi:hypothetical protein
MENKETLEEAAKRIYPINIVVDYDTNEDIRNIWIEGAKWKEERMYSEEDMINFAFDTYCYISILMKVPFNQISENKLHAMYNFEQFKKELL